MARKDSVADWDITPNNNDNVGGINIAENCAAANLNNAIRTVMAQIKEYSATVQPGNVYSTKNANYLALAADKNAYLRFTAISTLSLTAAATLTNGWCVWVMADGGNVTIDPNGAETINGLATLVINDGYSAFVICSGTAFYAVTITPEDVAELKLDVLQPFINVASATTTDIGAALSQNLVVTGTTTITSFGTADAGTVRNIVFSGALIVTHNPASLVLPSGANVTTAAGASLRAVSSGGGVWRVTNYQPATSPNPVLTAGDGLTSTGSLASGTMTVSIDIYTGSSVAQTSLPIGTVLMVRNDSGSIGKINSSASVRIAANDYCYTNSGGTLLSGTWRQRGAPEDSIAAAFFSVQRTA